MIEMTGQTTDPFLELIQLLRPRATLWGRTDAAGRWAVAFPKRDDLLFCWVESGECQLLRPHEAPLHLGTKDFVLIRTTAPFVIGSGPSEEPVNSETKAAGVRLGEGEENPVTLRGGRFVFDSANESLLIGLLPPLVHIEARDTSACPIRSLLRINATESAEAAPGSELIAARLVESVLVLVLRSGRLTASREQTGLIAGLADPITAPALSLIHKDVARDWTVSDLAKSCGVSRSGFAARFRRVVGTGPIDYLSSWRMALARDELLSGARGIGEIASKVGFASSSAFSKAFTRAVGCSPMAFADSARRGQ